MCDPETGRRCLRRESRARRRDRSEASMILNIIATLSLCAINIGMVTATMNGMTKESYLLIAVFDLVVLAGIWL
jgi:hypothetical protein